MKRIRSVLFVVVLLPFMLANSDCDPAPPTSASGVSKAAVQVKTGSDGLTVEQRNVRDRVTQDNKPGAIQHLYIISAYSGQVLLYSTVRGKVTSSAKRLTPTSVVVGASGEYKRGGFESGVAETVTSEVLGDDGTYGGSVEYIFWWDARGIYHQHYVTGGQIVHVASEPIAVKSVVMNLELR